MFTNDMAHDPALLAHADSELARAISLASMGHHATASRTLHYAARAYREAGQTAYSARIQGWAIDHLLIANRAGRAD